MTKTWIFFDIGWTLVDETIAHLSRLRRTQPILQELGIEKSIEDLWSGCEAAATDFAQSPYWGMLKSLGLTTQHFDYLKRHAPYLKTDEKLYDGVVKLLIELSKSHQLGVIANQSAGTLKRLESWGIAEHFSRVFASHELGLSKPDPRIFRAALDATNCAPVDAFMIGDRLDNDIGPAKKSGWQTIRVTQGFSQFQKPRGQHEKPDLQCIGIGDVGAFFQY